ncbi:crotonase/enoyl-CoA hydratase family protein [Aeromicrobium sp. CTD01-1L150]|uniref:crotonase/enoyl-CoA hydratase family protein n=1 Tax=Aeromicrobium sp. CTD01-1L150 TaxID=3341830 RepID=UPI0035BF907F
MNEPHLPTSIVTDRHGDVLVVRLARAQKRNALDDATVLGLERLFTSPPSWARSAVLDAEGDHFCAGLDLSELAERDTVEGLHHSRMWHAAFARIERGRLPVVAVLRGAVIGGGLELASACHVRVAEPSAYFALPEGQRGLFVGGGASVRVPRLIGTHRMTDMMLTGRVYDAEEGHRVGFSQYLVETDDGYKRALELAEKMATVSPVTTYGVIHALPRIGEADPDQGFFIESLMAAVAGGSDEAKTLMREFLDGRGSRVRGEGEA